MGNRPRAYTERLTITPELIERFAAYYRQDPAWGSLHTMLDDGNYGDAAFNISWAEEHGDVEGAELARLLARMSRSQQGRIAKRARAVAG